MATLARADISAAMSLILQDRLVNQFRKDAVLLNILEVQQGRNDALVWNPKFTGRTAGGAYAEGADMADGDFDSHIRTKATLNWAEYRAGAKVSGLAMAVANPGYAGVAEITGDLFDEELGDAIDKVAMDWATHMYSGNPGASPVQLGGAALAVDNALTSFAGLDPNTYGDWLGGENTNALSSISIDVLRTKLLRPVKDKTGRNPDFVTQPGNVYDAIKKIFDDKADVVHDIVVRGTIINIKAAAGAEAVMVDGVPFIEDRHATANTSYAFTEADLKIVQLPAKMPGRSPQRMVEAIKALTGVDVPITDVEQALRRTGVVVPTIEWLAQTGDAYKAMVKAYGQLKWRRRNSHAKCLWT